MGSCTNTSKLFLQPHLTHPPTLPPSQPANKTHGRSHKHKQPIKHKQPSTHNQPISPNSFPPTSSASKLQHQPPVQITTINSNPNIKRLKLQYQITLSDASKLQQYIQGKVGRRVAKQKLLEGNKVPKPNSKLN